MSVHVAGAVLLLPLLDRCSVDDWKKVDVLGTLLGSRHFRHVGGGWGVARICLLAASTALPCFTLVLFSLPAQDDGDDEDDGAEGDDEDGGQRRKQPRRCSGGDSGSDADLDDADSDDDEVSPCV